MFAHYGTIASIRKSNKKNFAHVRFEEEMSVDRALFLSGKLLTNSLHAG